MSTVFLADELELGSRYEGAINLSLVQDIMGGCAAKDNIFVYDCCALGGDDVPPVTGAGGKVIDKFPPGGKQRVNWVAISAARVGTKAFAMDEKGTLLLLGPARRLHRPDGRRRASPHGRATSFLMAITTASGSRTNASRQR